MVYFYKSVYVSTILYLVLYINDWSDVHICKHGRGSVDGLQNKFLLIWRSEHTSINAMDVFENDYDMINKLFWTKSIFEVGKYQIG